MTSAIIPDDHLKAVCRIGQGADCCRYIVRELFDAGPYECAKHDQTLKEQIDRRHAAGSMIARGDNCEGLKDEPTAGL